MFKKTICVYLMAASLLVPVSGLGQPDFRDRCPTNFLFVKRKGPLSIAFPDQLDRKKLDFSLESLNVVDAYLEYVYEHRDEMTPLEKYSTILLSGCYVGDVILRHSGGRYRWENYHSYMGRYEKLKKVIPHGVGTMMLLVDERDAMVMPLNKVARFISEGPENSVRYFASFVLARGRPVRAPRQE